MTDSASDPITRKEAYLWWREAAEKFDYFMIGLSAALSGYLGQSLRVSLDSLASIVETAAVLFFVASTVAGLVRVKSAVHVLSLQQDRISGRADLRVYRAATAGEGVATTPEGEALSPMDAAALLRPQTEFLEKLEPVLRRTMRRAELGGAWCQRLLVAGFLTLVLARVLPAFGL
jgi:hypothetical protein